MKKFSLCIRTLCVFVGLNLIVAPSAYALDLIEVYQLAQNQDPGFEAARHTLAAHRYKYPQARATVLPTINLTGNRTHQNGQASFANAPFNERRINSWGWNIQLTQPLLRVANWIGMDQAQAQFEQAQAQFDYAQNNLIVRITQAYFDILHSQDNMRVAHAQRHVTEQQSFAAKKRYEAGEIPITEVYDAQARFDIAHSQWLFAQQEQSNKEAELEQYTGIIFPKPAASLIPSSTAISPLLASLKNDFTLPKLEPNHVDAWLDSAYEHAPLIRTQRASLVIAEKEVEKNRAAHLPTLDFTASYSRNDSSGSLTLPADTSSRIKSAQVGIQLTVPLYAGGGTHARVHETLAYQYKARADLESARRQTRLLIRQAYNSIIQSQAQIQALNSAIHLNRKAVEANRSAYHIGQGIQLDILNAWQRLLAAQRDWAKVCYDALLNGLRLKAATGNLSADDMTQINANLHNQSSLLLSY